MTEDKDKPELKEVYEKIGKKYHLPEYEKLVEDFDVDKCDPEDEFLMRSFRRIIGEKVNAYIHFFEVLINPSSPPVYIYTFLKGLDLKKKQTIKDIYTILAKNQVRLMKLDTVYSEKDEAEFVKDFFKAWQTIKKDVYGVLDALESSFDLSSNAIGRSYLG